MLFQIEDENWLKSLFKQQVNFRLIYKASNHGWRHGDFYQNCAEKGPTLIICRGSNNERFGAYAHEQWKKLPNGEQAFYKCDKEMGFLFNIQTKLQFTLKDRNHVAYISYGKDASKDSQDIISMGVERDFLICEDKKFYSYGLCTYQHQNCEKIFDADANKAVGGSPQLNLVDLEVYSVEYQQGLNPLLSQEELGQSDNHIVDYQNSENNITDSISQEFGQIDHLIVESHKFDVDILGQSFNFEIDKLEQSDKYIFNSHNFDNNSNQFLSQEKEELGQSFNIIMLDSHNSDSNLNHLLTQECEQSDNYISDSHISDVNLNHIFSDEELGQSDDIILPNQQENLNASINESATSIDPD